MSSVPRVCSWVQSNCKSNKGSRRRHRQVASVVSDSVRPHGLQPTRLLCPWDSPGKNTGVGCHFLLQSSKASLSKLGKTKQKIPPRASRKALALSTLMLVHWDPRWTSDFQNCEIVDLWCLNLCVCGNVLEQQSELNTHVYHYIFLKAPSTLDLYISSACSLLVTISRLWL